MTLLKEKSSKEIVTNPKEAMPIVGLSKLPLRVEKDVGRGSLGAC